MALEKAAGMAGKPGRIMLLLSRLAGKVREINWKSVTLAGTKEKISVLGRLAKAYALGEYKNVPWKTILVILAAVIYFVNPIDLIPDLVPAIGLTDDFGVLLWVYSSVSVEIEKFLSWEKAKLAQ